MKKLLLNIVFLGLLIFTGNLSAQVSTLNTGPSGLCIGSHGYAVISPSVPAATSYTWSILGGSCAATFTPGGTGINITYPCCGIYTIYCSAYSSGTVFIMQLTNTVSVACNPAPVVTVISSTGSICSGNSATLSGAGAGSYTWIPGNLNGASIVVNPSSSNCYTAIGTSSAGCTNWASSCMSVIPTYTIGVAGSTAVCLGASTSLSLTGGPSFNTMPGNINSNNPVLTPSVSTAYTLTCPSNIYPCPSTTVIPVIVNPNPNVNISIAGSSTMCTGSTKTLVAAGNGITYYWSNGMNGSTIIVSPTANVCYSVIATNANGCVSVTSQCLNVLPPPNIIITGVDSVCVGSSINLTASGANSYTWNTSPAINTNTLSLIPSGSFNYMAYGTDPNGCNGFASHPVIVKTNCAIVWPGDANRDGQVSSTDVLELGLAAASTGAARSSTSNAWAGQFANAWTGTVSTGWNKVHADCDGDGNINSSDLIAISNNFTLTHAFKENSANTNNADIQLVPQQNFISGGSWNKIDLMLGDATNVQNQIYGITFDLNYDQTMVQPDSVKIKYTASFLNASNQNIDFGKVIFTNGKLYAATVRVDHSNVNGSGKIGELWLKTKTGLANNAAFNFGISNGQKVSSAGVMGSLSTSGSMNLNVDNTATGFSANKSILNTVHFYPNPANNSLVLLGDNTSTSYKLIDLSGRLILSGDFTSRKIIDISSINKGVYFIEFENANGKVQKKLVKE